MHLFQKSLPKDTENQALLEEIERVKMQMENAHYNFQNAMDPDLIDCYIYESNAAWKRYRFLLKQAKKLHLFLGIFFLLSALTGCGSFSIPTNANTAFRNFTLGIFQQEVASNTINLHYSLQEPAKYGITKAPVTFGSFDFDEATTLASIENLENALHKFSYDSLSKENQITYDILDYHFQMSRQSAPYYFYEEPLSPVTGLHAQLPVLLAEYQFRSTEDVEAYLALLETMPSYFSSLVRFEQQKSAKGLFMSDAVADEVIKQCDAFIAMGNENYLLSSFDERVNALAQLTEKEKAQLMQTNKQALETYVIPSYQALSSAITDLKGTGKNSLGLHNFPKGKDYYAYLIASETGTGRPIMEIKSLIDEQIAKDLLDCQQLLKENPPLTETTASLTEAPTDMLSSLKTKISTTFPTPAPVSVEVKYVPTALEPYLSPAFYLIPAIDNYNQNTIYINNAYSMDQLHLFTTLAHEGYPGHLYQTTYYAATNPDPLRTLFNFTGYVEGWATYAEMCSYYISSLEKPYAALLQKNNSLILGLYAAADIGIHYDGWSQEDTLSFFSIYGIDDATTIQEIYHYILGDPANYVTYYVGYLEMLELKKEMIEIMGNDFSQKHFHQQVLDFGPAPFELIRKYIF